MIKRQNSESLDSLNLYFQRLKKIKILTATEEWAVEHAARNLPSVKLLRAHYLNIRDLLSYDYLVIPQVALTVIEEMLG